MSASTAKSFPRHTHDQYGLGVIDSGGHKSSSDRCQVEAGPGSVISVNPGEVHDGRPIGGRPRSWRILYFDPTLMQELQTDVAERPSSGLVFAAASFLNAPLRQLFDAAFQASKARPGTIDRMRCETSLLRLVKRLSLRKPTAQAATAATPSIRRVVDLIEADPTDSNLTLQRLACEAGTSRYQLIRAFAREYCLTPHAYIVQRRLALARLYLRAGAPVAAVAQRTGFFDQSHLTHWFTGQFGVAPARYASAFAPTPAISYKLQDT